MTFSAKAPLSGAAPRAGRLQVSMNKTEIAKISKITWTGDKHAAAALNEAKANKAVCAALQNAAVAAIRARE
jgi:hypothetical protein